MFVIKDCAKKRNARLGLASAGKNLPFDTEDKCERPTRTVVFHDGDVKCRAASETKSDEQDEVAS